MESIFLPDLELIKSFKDEIALEYIRYVRRGEEVYEYPDKWLTSHRDGMKYEIVPLRLLNRDISMIQCQFFKTVELTKDAISVFFSILHPGTDLRVHRIDGRVSNHTIRAELPIIISEPSWNCGHWFDGSGVKHHTDDRWLIYDASNKHNSFNYSNGVSVVLTIDFERPESIKPGKAPVRDISAEMKEFIEKLAT